MWMRLMAFCVGVAGCTGVQPSVTFEFVHGTEDRAPTYRATTSDSATIALARGELEKPLLQRTLFINGVIARGSGSDNAPWNWHFVPDTWGLAELSIELCDGQPSYVQDNLDTWLAEVGSYCPWAAKVSREVP